MFWTASPAIYTIDASDGQTHHKEFELSDMYQPATESEQEKIDQFDPSRLVLPIGNIIIA